MSSSIEAIVGFVRFDWDALDGWYEEDEPVFVHPRNPYDGVLKQRPVTHHRTDH